MGTLSIPIPDDLEKSMKEFKLDWSGVAMKALIDKAERLKQLREFSSKFKLSAKDARELANRIDSKVAESFFKEAE